MDKITFIRRSSSNIELLLQLAEEANELAIATIEFQSLSNLDNRNNFIEEMVDVKLCIDVIIDSNNEIKIEDLEFDSYSNIYKNIIIESCKLSKSVLKLRRTIEPNASPTPITRREAEIILIENINRLLSYIELTECLYTKKAKNMYEEKLNRWYNRLITKG